MPIKKLLVHARGAALVTDYTAMANNVRRYIGRKVDASTIDAETDTGAAFVPTGEAATVPAMHEYVRHVQHGDLWAADQETADYCGVKFDPHFGETPKTRETLPPGPEALAVTVQSLAAPLSIPASKGE